MKLKKSIAAALMLPAFMLLALAAASCSGDDDNSKKKEEATGIRRTVVMYVSAQNSLGYQQFNISDSAEIAAGCQFLNARDQLLLYIDDAQKPRVYRFYKGCAQPQLVRTYTTDANSSDAGVLKELLAWTVEQYPSESYGLVMWSHSDGWVPSWSKDYNNSGYTTKGATLRSFGLDVGTGGNMETDQLAGGRQYGYTMDIDDMAAAIEESGMHPLFIFFDSCMMQCIEVDYALRNATDYVIASPISTPAIGANYTTMMRDALFKDDPSAIASNYYTYIMSLPATSAYYDFGMAISCVKTSELENFAAETRKLVSQISALKTDSLGNVSIQWPDMTGVTKYAEYSYTNFYRPHFYDLSHAMHNMLTTEQYTQWRKALDKCITYSGMSSKFYVGEDRTGQEVYYPIDEVNCCAISAFVPQAIYSLNAQRCIFGDLNLCFERTEWYEDAGWKEAGW